MALLDAVKVHLSHMPVDESSPVHVTNMAYAVEQDVRWDASSCPIFEEGVKPVYPNTFGTDMRILVPESAPRYVSEVTDISAVVDDVLDESSTTTGTTKESKPGAKMGKKEPPKNLVEFLQQYWMYILPVVVLFMLPGGVEVPEPPAQRSGQQGAAQRVTPGPSAAVARAKAQ